MRKYRLIAVWSALLLSACGGGGGSSGGGSNNPATTLVTVTYAGGTLAGIKVVLSTGLNNQTPTGIISTAATNASGQATLTLPPTGTLCVSASETTSSGVAFAGNCESQPFPSLFTLTL